MVDELNLEELRAMARRAGLRLVDDELQRLLPGVNRARQQVGELRELINRAAEPAASFKAGDAERG